MSNFNNKEYSILKAENKDTYVLRDNVLKMNIATGTLKEMKVLRFELNQYEGTENINDYMICA